MRQLELLAPARNLECGKAAVDHGADAVYIGAERFGARAAAGNSIDDISELCSYAHRFAAKVYVTVNTILYDDELEATRELLRRLEGAGVDAVIAQDMALVGMAGQMPLHASTQTDNRTADKVRWLRDTGFQRAVLARELSVSDIAAIHSSVPDIELEVFVHGALCVSYSGLCYASQQCFHRSANRGECAQFCRLKFDLVDADGIMVERGRHLLSLKDMNQSDNIGRLVEAGATSFKIEGRLKNVAYVKNVTAAYSQILDRIVMLNPDKYCRASLGKCSYAFKPDLRKTFNRGFTTYFADGRQPDISSPDTPKAVGEFVGHVKEIRGNSFNVSGTASFANGDGLCFVNRDRQLEGFRVNRVEGNRLFPHRMPAGLQSGMRLYRNNDRMFEHILARPSSVRKIGITMELKVIDGGFRLVVTAPGGRIVSADAAAEHQQAERPQHENTIRQLTKLGSTVYECVDVVLPDDVDYFIPGSVLAGLRRTAVERLERQCVPRRRKLPRQHIESAATPEYPNGAMYNISNHAASDFYAARGIRNPAPAFELCPDRDTPLMQCRHCLRYSLGYCVKNGGRKPSWREPLYLLLPDGSRFRLRFDCHNCRMSVFVEK